MNTDIIDDLQQDQTYVLATQGRRLVNFIVDIISFYVLAFLVVFFIGLAVLDDEQLLEYATQDSTSVTLIEYIIAFGLFFTYYFMTEFFLKGKTLGKFITKTRAVKYDNTQLDAKDAALRTLTRIIPFEPFSFLMGDVHGWHDKWTETYVIEDDNWTAY